MGKRAFNILLFLLVCGISTCWAGDASLDDKNIAIHTYGGGSFLADVLRAVSMLIYGNTSNGIDQTYNCILRIALTIGGLCSFYVVLLREKFEHLIKSFFFPAIFVMSCLLIPRTTVYIQDHLAVKSNSTQEPGLIVVEKVPFFFGKLISLVSTISHTITDSLEEVLHRPNEPLYNWTGHIYAGENIFLTKKCRIANPVLEDNFREFCHQCVYRDLGLGLYSKTDLVNSKDLLNFLAERTSKIRTVLYREISENNKEGGPEGSFITCRDAMQKMKALFNGNTANTQELLHGEISNDFQYLLKEKEKSPIQNLIKQQMAIHILKEEIPGSLSSFAAKRAQLLQRENQKILGFLGADSIITAHIYLEALVYLVFPLVIIISLLSFGLKVLIHWTHFVLWISLWPPLYVVAKYLLTTIWDSRAVKAFGSDFNLTLFTSDGLAELYNSMEGYAFVALSLIPPLAWALLQGGVASMVHFASSVISPSHTSASTAASEKAYGNYSYNNVNVDNANGHNAQIFRQTYSGQLSSGSLSVDSGSETMTYTPGSNALYIKQGDSYLREGISHTQAFSSAIQDSLSSSQTALSEKSLSYSENLSDSTNRGAGLVQALSKQFQTGTNYNAQTTTGLQEAVQYMQGLGNDYAKSHGVSTDQGLRAALSTGIGFNFGLKARVDGSYQTGITQSEAESVLGKAFDSETFQQHMQKITNFSSGEMANVLGSEDARLHEDFVRSYNQTVSSSEQVRAAYTQQESLANLKSFSESEDVRIHQNLNHRFVEFVQAKFQDQGKINQILDMRSELPEKQALIREFVNDFFPRNPMIGAQERIQRNYETSLSEVQKVTPETFAYDKAHLMKESEEQMGLTFGQNQALVNDFQHRIEYESHQGQAQLNTDREKIEQDYQLKSEDLKKAAIKSEGVVYHELFGFSENPP